MRHSTLLLTLIVVAYSLSCVSRGHSDQPGNSPSEERTAILRSIPALVNEETHPAVEAIETQIKGEAGSVFEFKQAQFVTEMHGWAMSGDSLYRTKDGGKTWERLPPEPEKEATFETFFFINESRGWLTAVKRAYTKRYGLGNSSMIMVTDDGGESWKRQASFANEVVINELRFFNANEGLAVGGQVIDDRPPYHELLVLRTSNGGSEWNNISEAAKTAIKEEYGLPSDAGKHIEWTASSVLLLTRFGRIINSTDNGKTWKLVVTLKREMPNGNKSTTGNVKLVLDPQQRIRIVAVGYGGEYAANFVIQENSQWTSYDTKLTPIRDALFLSNNEVLACGASLWPNDDERKRHPANAGVILRSFDSGKSWQPIYRSKSYETFFYLTKVKDNQFYAVSDTGTFLRFNLPL